MNYYKNINKDKQFYKSLLKGLKELAETAFPKKCKNCGRVFKTADIFLNETKRLNPSHSGLKESSDDDDKTILEVYRNCVCGSTLMDFFTDRRDKSKKGENQRRKFGNLLEMLENKGMDKDKARNEILKIIKGKQSNLLKSNTI